MPNIGRMRHRITLQQPPATDGSPTTQDAGGVVTENWTTVATVWAEVEPLQGRELLAAQQVNPEITGRIRIRYRDGITEQMRALLGSRVLDIVAVINKRERNRELTLMYKEGASNG